MGLGTRSRLGGASWFEESGKMPPKKDAPNKKTVEKKKEKVIEDKTFGLKNKKGKKQQTFIKQVTNQVKFGGTQSVAKREADAYQLKKEKAEREKEKAALDALFKPVAQVQKVSAGADPKSVLCVFFKQGHCSKGEKCKFSHDLSLENKAEKRSVYVDSRDLEEDTIDKWDTGKLEEVVNKKHSGKMKTKTEIVCKHFLHAIDKGVYGWFWECPNGADKCMYRHALPPGFVLKKQQKEQEELQPQDTITLDELVEKERESLASSGRTLTKVTLDSFLAWKKRKLKEKSEAAEKDMAKKKEAYKHGKTLGISGREMFLFNPELVAGDDEDEEGGGVVQIVQEPSEEDKEEGAAAVDLTNFAMSAEGSGDTVKSEGEASCEAAGVDSGAHSERGVASAEGLEEDVVVDEALFLEEVDDEEEVEEDNECIGGVVKSSVMEEPAMDVDESLFDVDNLQDLNLDDPAILETPGRDS